MRCICDVYVRCICFKDSTYNIKKIINIGSKSMVAGGNPSSDSAPPKFSQFWPGTLVPGIHIYSILYIYIYIYMYAY